MAAVSFAQSKALLPYVRDLRLPFPLLSDTERGAYKAYGLLRGSFWSIFGPKTVWEYVKLIPHGRLFRGIQADPFQLGGDFVIDGRGSCASPTAARSRPTGHRRTCFSRPSATWHARPLAFLDALSDEPIQSFP